MRSIRMIRGGFSGSHPSGRADGSVACETRWRTAHSGCGDRPGCSPGQSAAVTAIPHVVCSGGLDGRLRAYSSEDGRILWDVDTVRDYATVNGVPAHGGT